ncbi:hypothetical protein DL98DRAFT_538505 [Cadophora sp. DSE1049]|nr:hypothetical protein DL98DRAFT_538505 [Cadophora sp. DSE1049]
MEYLPFYSSEELMAPSRLAKSREQQFQLYLDAQQLKLCRQGIPETLPHVPKSVRDIEAGCNGTGDPANMQQQPLPKELWTQICEQLDYSDCKQVRLVSKFFCDIPCKKLFTEIFVAALPDSLQKLQCIAEHPILSTKVQKITYLIDRLDSKMICRARWESLVGNVDTGTLSRENYRKYSNYCALQGVQQQLSWRQEDLRIIHKCVALLINVREIVTTSWPSLRQNPEFVHGKQPILTGLYRETGLHPYELFHPGRPSDPPKTLPHTALICGIQSSKASLKKLTLNEIPWDFWNNAGGVKDDIFPQFGDSIVPAFASLENLDLTMRLGNMGSASNSASPISQLIKFLSAAPKLESLRLNVRRLQNLGTASIYLTRLFEKAHWPHLSSSHLNAVKLDRDAFISFFKRHSGTLKHLTLTNIQLYEKEMQLGTDGDQEQDDWDSSLVGTRPGECWVYAVESLAPVLMLKSARMSGCFDDYVFRRSRSTGSGSGFWKIPEAELGRFRRYCEDLTTYIVLGGRGNWDYELPVYG